MHSSLKSVSIETEQRHQSLNGRQIKSIINRAYDFNGGQEALLTRSKLMAIRCDSVQSLAACLAAWDEAQAHGGGTIPEPELAELFSIAFDFSEMQHAL